MRKRSHSGWRRIIATLVSTTVIFGISSTLALTLAVGAPPLLGQSPPAWACGIAGYVMLANNAPAMPVPGSQIQGTTNQGVDNLPGYFPTDYYRGQAITFTEDLSAVPYAPPKDSIQWRWDFGDGSSYGSGPQPTHTYQRAGKFTITVSVFDTINNVWNPLDTSTITILNSPWSNPPIAKATASKTIAAINDTVTFDATGSRAQVGSQLTYDWNFDDGSTDLQGPHVTYQFTIPGKALVTLTVTDSRGAISTAVIPIQVVISIPQVHLQVSATTAQVGQTITFDASQVQLQPGDQIAKYTWDFGDQTPAQTTTSSKITHRYSKAGKYHAQVQVLDTQNVPGTAAVDITVGLPQSASTGSSVSPGSFTFIALGALIVLALGALVIGSIWRRKPAPVIQGSRAPARRPEQVRRTPNSSSLTGQRISPHSSLSNQPSGHRQASGRLAPGNIPNQPARKHSGQFQRPPASGSRGSNFTPRPQRTEPPSYERQPGFPGRKQEFSENDQDF
jgi:PKD repeat protein